MDTLFDSRRNAARLAKLMTIVQIVISVFTFAFILYEALVAPVDFFSSGAFDTIATFVGVAHFITMLVWIYRADRTLHELGVHNLRFTPAWSVGWFFIPVMNIFRPFQVMQEIWMASTPRPDESIPFDWENASASGYILVWWIASLIENLAAIIALFLFETMGFMAFFIVVPAAILSPALFLGLVIMVEERLDRLETDLLIEEDAVDFSEEFTSTAF